MTQEQKIERYKELAHNRFIQVNIARMPNFYKNTMLRTLGLNEQKFYVSCDDIRNEADIEIMQDVLKINQEIIWMVRDKNIFHTMSQSSYHTQVVLYDVDILEYSVSSDVHIFLYNTILLSFLYECQRVFNAVHPRDFPKKNPASISYWGTLEKLQFFFGDNAKKISNYFDLFYYYFKDYLPFEAITKISQTFSKERFLLQLSYMVNNRQLVMRAFELANYEFKFSKISATQVMAKKSNQFCNLIEDKLF